MKLTKDQQKKVLLVLVLVIIFLNGYYYFTGEKSKTAPLTYARGAIASSPVRQGLLSKAGEADPLTVFLARKEEKYPGVVRDIFRMENPSTKPMSKPKLPPPPVVTAPTPTVPEKTTEQIAKELATAELSKFRFLGYLTEKDNTLFLSKDGELFMVKSGGVILNNYMIKETGKDYVVLIDTITLAEVRVELSGGEQAPPSMPSQPPQLPRFR